MLTKTKMAESLRVLTIYRSNRDLPEEWWAKADEIIASANTVEALRMMAMFDHYINIWRRHCMHLTAIRSNGRGWEIGSIYAHSLLANWAEEEMRARQAQRQLEMAAARPWLNQRSADDTIGHIFRFL